MAVTAQDEGDDGSLVLAVQRGDGDAFAELFRRHYPPVRQACARRLFDSVEADEVAQAAFVRAYERIEQCGGERRFGPWVHVIARSLCQDAFRAQARVEPFAQPLAGRDHRPNEPEESLLRSERAAQVHAALATLPDRQRRAVIARDWDELGPGEIADSLGLSVGAVDSLLLRARRRLALSYRRLAGEGGGGASTLAVRSGAAAVAAVLALGSQTIASATAVAAQTVQDAAGRAASGVVGAVMSVAVTLGATSTPVAPPPDPPAPVTAPVTVTVAPAPTSGTPRPAAAPAAADRPAAGPTGSPPPEQQVVVPPIPVTTSPPTPTPTTTLPERPRTARATPTTTTPTTTPTPPSDVDDEPVTSLPPVSVQVGLPPVPTVPAVPLSSLPLPGTESPHGKAPVGG